MGTSVSLRPLGVAVRVAGEPSLLHDLESRLAHGWGRRSRRGTAGVTLDLAVDRAGVVRATVDDRVVAAGEDRCAVLDAVERWLRHHVARSAADRCVLHAGSVHLGGRALVVAGRSWSGKSTLVDALLRCGATYGADDLVVIGPDGLVEPVRTPLCRRGDKGGAQRWTLPSEAASCMGRWVPAAVVLCRFRPESHPGLELTRLSPATAAVRLFAHAVTARRAPQPTLAALLALGRRSVVWAGTRGEAAVAAPLLIERMAASGVRPPQRGGGDA